jgi:short-subunit dehydrogenase
MEPRNAIVTGASHGIGRYIARALAARHMNLLLVARSEAGLARLATELETDGSKAAVAAVDLGDPSAARQIAEVAAVELGTVDVLVNNAATKPQTRFHVLTPAEIGNVLQVDLVSPAAARPAPAARHARTAIRPDHQHLLAGRAYQFPVHRGLRRGQGRAHRLQPGAGQGLPGHRG